MTYAAETRADTAETKTMANTFWDQKRNNEIRKEWKTLLERAHIQDGEPKAAKNRQKTNIRQTNKNGQKKVLRLSKRRRRV